MIKLSVIYDEYVLGGLWNALVVEIPNITIKGADSLEEAQVFMRHLLREEIGHDFHIKKEIINHG